jgi:curved DNA-binding protein CbpA
MSPGVARVFLSFDDLGLGIQVVDALEAAGHRVDWSRAPAAGPPAELAAAPDAVLLGGVEDRACLGGWISAWRGLDPPPVVVVIGRTEEVRRAARSHRAPFVLAAARPQEVVGALSQALALRFAAELDPRFARHALDVGPRGDSLDSAAAIIERARTMPIEIAREALRPHLHDYVRTTPRIEELRARRALVIPEIQLAASLDGAITLHRATSSGAMSQADAVRALWAFLCTGVASLTPEPPDDLSPDRRAVSMARHHLRARSSRLTRGKAHYYEVLEVSYPPSAREIGGVVRRLALRFSPERVSHLDLGDMTPYVEPLWEQIEKAQRMLSDPTTRAQYDQYLVSKGADIRKLEIERSVDVGGAEADFVRGQQALTDGKLHHAVSLFASAARRYPGHLDYEAYLAWARYRSALERGEDKRTAAMRERAAVEEMMAGRAPRARALLALGLLCTAGEDGAAARWYLEEALVVDPGLQQARQILSRLS